jgi:hypothetical protein
MDKTLESFLHPKRHPNIRFRLPAFESELEIRELTVDETARIDREAAEKGWQGSEVIRRYAAQALVTPDLHAKELLDALSEREGHKILNAYDAFKALFTGPEATKIAGKYIDLANLGVSFPQKVEEAKN